MESFHLRLRTALKARRAFTLIELLVVLAIISIISVVTLNSQSSFNKTLILANTAYDIALTLRSAESFGIGSRATTLGTANAGYGVHFQTGNTLTLFADTSGGASCAGMPPDCKPGDHVYNDPNYSNDTLVQTYTLNNSMTISNLYANGASVNTLDIVFARPNPDAFVNGSSNINACIVVSSSQGTFRYIRVEPSGAIIANATSCL